MAVKNRRTITSWGQAFPSISGGNEPAVPALLTSLGWLENRYSEDYLGISNIENRMVSNHGLMNVSNWRGS